MLPSKGYFNSLSCPYFDNSKCHRPHCHFRHTKKEKTSDDLSQSEEMDEEAETTQPNEDLYNILSDINTEDTVSLVNDKELWLSQQSKNVKYKPTPIAELRKRHIPITTAPSMTASQHLKTKIEGTRKLKAEYHPGALNTNRTPAPSLYKATKIKDTSKDCSNEEDNVSQVGEDSEEEIDFDQISTAFNFLDKFLHDYDNKPKQFPNSGNFENNDSDNSVIRDNTDTRLSPNSTEINACNDECDNILSNFNEDSSNKLENDRLPKLDGIYLNHEEKQNVSQQKMNSAFKENNESLDSDSKINSSVKQKDVKLKSSNQQNNLQNNVKKGSKRTHEHLSESKYKKKHKTDRDKKKESHHKKNKVENETSTINENNKNINKSSNKESTHRHISNSSSNKNNHTKVSSSKLSKKESDHKNTSSTSSNKESRSSSKISKEKSAVSKNEHISSLQEHHTSSKTKDDSRSKRSSIEGSKRSSSEKSQSSGKHKEAKHRKEINDKKKQPDKRRNTQMDKDDIPENHSPPKRMRKEKIDAAIILDDDDDVEIVSDTVSVIVIDSEEELSDSSTKMVNDKDRPTSSSSSHERSPILPSGESFSESEEETAQFIPIAGKNNTVKDDSADLDHRVKSNIKNRVSLGVTWRPPPKKPVHIMTPAARNAMYRNQAQVKDSEVGDGEAAARVRIGCVPNVHSYLKEKDRLLTMANQKRLPTISNGRSNSLSLRRFTFYDESSTASENEDKPPKVVQTRPHPHKSGADLNRRQQSVELLYKTARHLVKPGDKYRSAQVKCLEVEEQVWLNTNKDTYEKEIKNRLRYFSEKISDFTLKYFTKIQPRLCSIYLNTNAPGSLTKSHGKSEQGSIRLYDALKKHILTDEQLESEGYPRRKKDPLRHDLAYINQESLLKYKKICPAPPRGQKLCDKCHNFYTVDDDGLSIDENGCNYHAKAAWYWEGCNYMRRKLHRCCNRPQDQPCMNSDYHSTESKDMSNLEGFLETVELDGLEPKAGWGVFGLDCEMYWSTEGIELGRVTVVNTEERIVFDTCVKPEKLATDYATRMSGLTKESLDQAKLTLRQVQECLMKIINSRTILIGHSLESDLKALKLIHNTVVDTAVVYESDNKKVALKVLAQQLLNEVIQNEEDGHNSAEDAVTCIKLMRHKLLKEYIHASKPKAPILKGRYSKPSFF